MKIVQPAFKVLPTGGATAALPVWAYFMKLCYADENLKVSKGEFERPANLSIRVDCYNARCKDTTATLQNTDEFEF
jgi:penicillin-binding protein 1A